MVRRSDKESEKDRMGVDLTNPSGFLMHRPVQRYLIRD